jgi:Integrase core domain
MSLPELPWQKVATDLFELDTKNNIVVVDYYPRFFEVARLPGQTTEEVIKALRDIFGHFGCPMVCVSDGGPAYKSSRFEEFTKAYGFIYQTPSPRFAQSNGASERAV